MPIELGIALGAKHLGRSSLRDHQLLVLDTERYRYQSFASDLAGVDIAAHHGQSEVVIRQVRDFLSTHGSAHLPGGEAIGEAYRTFEGTLPVIAAEERQTVHELIFADRLRHVDAFLESLG